MKILMVSIFAPHFFNWTEQLKESGHEVYWLDVFDSNTQVKKIDFAKQIIGWRYRWDYPGRYRVKSEFPVLNRLFNLVNQRKIENKVQKLLEAIKPDLVHSFVIQSGALPILKVMRKHNYLKWAVSTWGSDIFYHSQNPSSLKSIKEVLNRADYLFTDCNRDREHALKLGFRGEFLGVFPGGGGYEFSRYSSFRKDFDTRKVVLVKGYENKHGKCISVLKALERCESILRNYEVVIFGASHPVEDYLEERPNLKKQINCLGKISHNQVMMYMGKAKVYIGNSTSDGLPNTLLEAMVMGAFPIQSNPGGATSEIVVHKINGLLIQRPEDESEILQHLEWTFQNEELVSQAINTNFKLASENFNRDKIKSAIQTSYALIERDYD